jgi:hypothetical protein
MAARKSGVSPIDLVAGDPRRRELRLDCTGDQRSRKSGFNGEMPLVVQGSGVVAAFSILSA